MNSKMERFLYHLCLLCSGFFTAARCESDCDVTPCPIQTPLCTTAGCVNKCPENSFINGTRCVLNCGDRVTDGNICKDVCPAERQFTEYKVFVVGRAFQRARICVDACAVESFVYNNSCVSACPADLPFVVNMECKPVCPDDQNIGIEKKTSTNYTYVECSNLCNADKPVLKNQTCVSKCDDGEVVFKGSCVEECPTGFEYLQLSKGVDITDKVCVQDCGDEFYLGRNCVPCCPVDMLVANKSCVISCPPSTPYTLYNHEEATWLTNRIAWPIQQHNANVCLVECPSQMFYDNNNCVSKCPNGHDFVYNKACVASCPSETPLVYDFCTIESCYSYKNTYQPIRCVNTCPNSFAFNLTCVKQCPTRHDFVYNKTCVAACPSETPLVYDYCTIESCYSYENTYQPLRCVNTCPNSFAFNLTCVKHCPKMVNDSQCVEECPKNKPYIETRSYESYNKCVDKCSDRHVAKGLVCIDQDDCKQSIIYDGKCLDTCPDGMYWNGYSNQYGSCQSRENLYGAAFTIIMLMVAMVIMCTVFFRFKPFSCVTTVLRSKIIGRRSRQSEEYQPVLEEDITASAEGINMVV